jgi:hypothetical protein
MGNRNSAVGERLGSGMCDPARWPECILPTTLMSAHVSPLSRVAVVRENSARFVHDLSESEVRERSFVSICPRQMTKPLRQGRESPMMWAVEVVSPGPSAPNSCSLASPQTREQRMVSSGRKTSTESSSAECGPAMTGFGGTGVSIGSRHPFQGLRLSRVTTGFAKPAGTPLGLQPWTCSVPNVRLSSFWRRAPPRTPESQAARFPGVQAMATRRHLRSR